MTDHKKRLFFWATLLVLSLGTLSSEAALKPEECLECHDAYKSYQHGAMACNDCHSSIKSLPHADKLPRPTCVACHKNVVSSFSGDVHSSKGLECKECHNVHYIAKDRKFCVSCHGSVTHTELPSARKHLSKLLCRSCHGRPDKMGMTVQVQTTSGPSLNAALIDKNGDHRVSRVEWHAFNDILQKDYKGSHTVSVLYQTEADAHTIGSKPTACRNCHTADGYFKSAQLQVTGNKNFRIAIDPTIFVPELPSTEEFNRTVHGKNGVACADCHKSQKHISEGWSENSTICVNCHQSVYETYKASIHSKKGATHCVDCHNPHHIKSYRELNADERVAVCSRCHTDYLKKHQWLPNTVLHFQYLECATCHSPRSAKSMIFYFARKTAGKKEALSREQLIELYGSDPLPLIRDGMEGISAADTQIGRIFSELTRRDSDILIDASIVVTQVHHDYSETRLAEKGCVTCHSGEASFYNSMFFVLPGKESSEYVPVRGTLFSSLPIGGFVDFFLLGENKIRKADVDTLLGKITSKESRYASAPAFKLIDLFGILLIVLILFGVTVHAILRVLVKR